jgi:hypothetical protein
MERKREEWENIYPIMAIRYAIGELFEINSWFIDGVRSFPAGIDVAG